MNRIFIALVFGLTAVSFAAEPGQDQVAFRIRFGMKDQKATDWSGTVTPSSGKVESIRGWRWMPGDHAKDNTFTVGTRRQGAQNAADRKRVQAGERMPMTDNGVVVTMSGVKPDDSLKFEAGPGNFEFKLS